MHFKNSIYEIDGLQEGPILIKDNIDKKDWTSILKDHISERIALYANYEIKFNLLYITDDKLMQYKKSLSSLDESIDELTKKINENKSKEEVDKLQKEMKEKNNLRYELNYLVKEEERKRQISKEENERRQHNYIPLIYEILESLSKNDNLEDIYNQALKEENQNNMNKTKKEV